jgi:hypothetical protein
MSGGVLTRAGYNFQSFPATSLYCAVAQVGLRWWLCHCSRAL